MTQPHLPGLPEVNTIKIAGIDVYFVPDRKPFPQQLALMSSIIRACTEGTNALLESPTGTGKTLALLSAALSFQRAMKVKAEEFRLANNANSTPATAATAGGGGAGGGEVPASAPPPHSRPPTPNPAAAPSTAPVPRIVFTSRTHSQLAQAIGELRKCNVFATTPGSIAATVRAHGLGTLQVPLSQASGGSAASLSTTTTGGGRSHVPVQYDTPWPPGAHPPPMPLPPATTAHTTLTIPVSMATAVAVVEDEPSAPPLLELVPATPKEEGVGVGAGTACIPHPVVTVGVKRRQRREVAMAVEPAGRATGLPGEDGGASSMAAGPTSDMPPHHTSGVGAHPAPSPELTSGGAAAVGGATGSGVMQELSCVLGALGLGGASPSAAAGKGKATPVTTTSTIRIGGGGDGSAPVPWIPRISMGILSSRAQSCVNHALMAYVRGESDAIPESLLKAYGGEGKGYLSPSALALVRAMGLDDACSAVVKAGTCTHHGGVERLKAVLPPVWDLEDLAAMSAAGNRNTGLARGPDGRLLPHAKAGAGTAAASPAGGCPFFLSRDMIEKADVVFCPYNYVLDPLLRKAMKVDLHGAILIIDEAHNVEDTCRDAASCELTRKQLVDTLQNLGTALRVGHVEDKPCITKLKELVTRILIWFDHAGRTLGLGGGNDAAEALGAVAGAAGDDGAGAWPTSAIGMLLPLPTPLPARSMHYSTTDVAEFLEVAGGAWPAIAPTQSATGGGFLAAGGGGGTHGFRAAASSRATAGPGDDGRYGEHVWSGEEAVSMLASCGVTLATFASYAEALDQAMASKVQQQQQRSLSGWLGAASESDPSNDRDSLTQETQSVLERLLLVFGHMLRRDLPPLIPGALGPLGALRRGSEDYRMAVVCRRDGLEDVRKVCWWCMSPAVAFREVATTTRSVVLTSGTLAPLDSFASELGVPFPVRLEAPHVVDVTKQVWAGVVSSVPPPADLTLVPRSPSPPSAVAPGTTRHEWRVDARHSPSPPGVDECRPAIDMLGVYANVQRPEYVDGIGSAVLSLATCTPGGLLVFLPSYKLLERVCAQWRATRVRVASGTTTTSVSLWQALNMVKPVFVEPRDGGAGAFVDMLSRFRAANDAAEADRLGRMAPTTSLPSTAVGVEAPTACSTSKRTRRSGSHQGGKRGRSRAGGRGGGSDDGGGVDAVEVVAVTSEAGASVRGDGGRRWHGHGTTPATAGHGPGSGGIMLAVCRGKASEGLDFSDHHARLVVLVGIPFPNASDTLVSLKREYQDWQVRRLNAIPAGATAHLARPIPGKAWYKQQAFRALNQALGRCLRHRHDYGGIVLLDPRFNLPDELGSLSKWVQKAVRIGQPWEATCAQLSAFFPALEVSPPATWSAAPPAPPLSAPITASAASVEGTMGRTSTSGDGRVMDPPMVVAAQAAPTPTASQPGPMPTRLLPLSASSLPPTSATAWTAIPRANNALGIKPPAPHTIMPASVASTTPPVLGIGSIGWVSGLSAPPPRPVHGGGGWMTASLALRQQQVGHPAAPRGQHIAAVGDEDIDDDALLAAVEDPPPSHGCDLRQGHATMPAPVASTADDDASLLAAMGSSASIPATAQPGSTGGWPGYLAAAVVGAVSTVGSWVIPPTATHVADL